MSKGQIIIKVSDVSLYCESLENFRNNLEKQVRNVIKEMIPVG